MKIIFCKKKSAFKVGFFFMVSTLRNNELGMQSGFRAYILKIIPRYCGTSACITRNNLYVLNDTITLCKATSFRGREGLL